jgi:hypothetical protein
MVNCKYLISTVVLVNIVIHVMNRLLPYVFIFLLCNSCRQFKYIGTIPKEYKYGTRLGVILKQEYPGLVEEKDSNVWEDYKRESL